MAFNQLLTVGLIGLLGYFNSPEYLRTLLVGGAAGYFLYVALTSIREFGRAIVAQLLGFRVYRIQIGWYGRRLFWVRLGRCVIEFRRIPLGGLTVYADPACQSTRIETMAITAAGPFVHLAVIGGLFVCVPLLLPDEWLRRAANVCLATNIVILAWDLYPFNSASPAGEYATDGVTLWTLIKMSQLEFNFRAIHYYLSEAMDRLEQHDAIGALQACTAGLDRFPSSTYLAVCRGLCALNLGKFDEARSRFVELRNSPKSTPQFQAVQLSNIAWTDLLSGESTALPEALEYSEQAYLALPWSTDIKGTRGCVLIEAGQVAEGMRLAREALHDDESPFGRAFNAAFLALGYLRLDDGAQARKMLALAERLDSRCSMLDRVRQRLAAMFA